MFRETLLNTAEITAKYSFGTPKLKTLILCACLGSLLTPVESNAAGANPNEPGWLPVVIARGALKEQIDATPIEERPYRPLHFYGNTVRRLHYRGTAFPRLGEVIATPVRIVTPHSQTKPTDQIR